MPRSAVLYIATSLDGYIAGRNHEIDWLFTDQDYGFTEFMASIDTIVMGRRSYDIAASLGEWPYHGKTCYVCTRTPTRTDPRVLFTDEDPGLLLRKLRALGGKAIWIFGGGEIATQAAAAEQIDEYVIAVHPILLGEGIPLWRPFGTQLTLTLTGVQKFNTGLTVLSYARHRADSLT